MVRNYSEHVAKVKRVPILCYLQKVSAYFLILIVQNRFVVHNSKKPSVANFQIEEIPKMMQYQYLISGAISIFLSFYILAQSKKSIALKFLSIYGFAVSLWEITSFISKTAPTAILAAAWYRITLLTSHLCYPLYLWSVLNINKQRDLKIFSFVFSRFRMK